MGVRCFRTASLAFERADFKRTPENHQGAPYCAAMKLSIETGSGSVKVLVAIADVEAMWSQMMSVVRSRMLLLPDKLAQRVAVVSNVLECREIVDREIREALTVLSDKGLHAE